MIFFILFLEFFKIGLFSIGGGLATIPFLRELTSRYDWFTMEDLTNMIAISESTPGPVGINMATFAGINASGIWGGIIATLSLVLPSFIIICIVNKVLNKYKDSQIINSIFTGVRPCVVGIIAAVVLSIIKLTILKDSKFNIISIILIVVLAFLINTKKLSKLSPIIWILASGVLGVIFKLT